MKGKDDMMVKVIAILVVMVFPIVGLLLVQNAAILSEEYFWIGVLLILLFPLIVAANILRYKGKV